MLVENERLLCPWEIHFKISVFQGCKTKVYTYFKIFGYRGTYGYPD